MMINYKSYLKYSRIWRE